ncbi:MAG: alkaline phosphatase D family protein [Deltaproteobacteria bacterium]|nr:alkaline phosphatase D family protein [Deltaproteobacteria bacterium]
MRRRELIRTTGAAAVVAALPACDPQPVVPSARFAWGVASGDPTSRAVMVWTRLAVDRDTTIRCDVFRDASERELVTSASASAMPARDGCVKLDVVGLEPATTYYFRFVTEEGDASPLGRTRTLPEGEVARMRLAFVTCTNFAYGLFHGYRRIAERADLALVVHLGDTIYEYADGVYGDLRALDPPRETVTLEDYRRRHAHYRLDPDLKEMQRQHPIVPIWDDHEFANNAHTTGSLTHDPVTQGAWSDRVAAAKQAFFEWTPTRDETQVHRSLELGSLARLVLLDARMDGREAPPIDTVDWMRSDRRLVSDAQEAWLGELVSGDDVAYTVLGNQVVLAPFAALENLDAWDGFPAQRQRVMQALSAAPSLPIVMTGDTHGSLALDLPGPTYAADTQLGSIGVEWGAPALASPHFTGEASRARESMLLEATPHLRFTEQEKKGYVLLDLDDTRARAEWWLVEDATRADGNRETLTAAFEARADDRASREAELAPSPVIEGAPSLAPDR